MLGSNERLQVVGDNRRFSQLSNELSASQTSIGSTGSDIQQHLQSMFYLLRPEETLKMVRKIVHNSLYFLAIRLLTRPPSSGAPSVFND